MSADPSSSSIRRSQKAERLQGAGFDRRNEIGEGECWELSKPIRKRQKRPVFPVWAAAIDMLCITLAFAIASYIRLGIFDVAQVLPIAVCLNIIYLGMSFNNKSYQLTTLLDVFKSSWRASTALAFSAASVLALAFFIKSGDGFSRLLFGLGFILALGSIIAWRYVLARIVTGHMKKLPFSVLCIYDGMPKIERSHEGCIGIDAGKLGLSPDPADPKMIERLSRVAVGIDQVAIYCAPDNRASWAFMLKFLSIKSEIVVPELAELHPLDIQERSGQASLVLSSGGMIWEQRLLKRTFDLAVVCAIMPALLPILLIVALMVKLDSAGPVFFAQERIGLGNRKFKILKFRSMRIDMQDDQASKLTERNDPRVTRVGEFIRKTSLDELPQFINVLKGDMSVVGPRPHAERALAGRSLYWEVDATYWHRHVVKPGITGLAQIRGHRGNTFEEQQLRDRLNADLEYVAHWSLLADINIMLRTLGVLFHRNAF